MDTTQQLRRADEFRRLHRPGAPLVLINVWDAVSAKLVEQSGAPAIATTSAGIAWACGYPDGERIPRDEMLRVVARIASAVSVPVTADLEAGYAHTPSDVAETVRLAIAVGAVGMNLEDGTDSPGETANPLFSVDVAAERVAAARAAADACGIPFVINARTDVFLRAVGDPDTRLSRATERLNAYRAAGADSLFAPGVRDAETIAALARDAGGPLNILAVPGMPSLAELARLRVARVSLGSGAMRATLSALARAATSVHESGSLDALLDAPLPFASIDALMQRPGE